MGDLVLVIDDKRMMKGVHRDEPIVIDIEDKVTTLEEEETPDNKIAVIIRDKSNMIGEVSNYATAYHNKMPQSQETAEKYNKYICLLSITNGKIIDSSKTGVVCNVPRHIAKYGRPLPYFMKYASDYYKHMKKLSYTRSNMNLLCKEIEIWHNSLNWRKTFDGFSFGIMKQNQLFVAANKKDFDYTIMMDKTIPMDDAKLEELNQLFKQFYRESAVLSKRFREALSRMANGQKLDKDDPDNINWQAFYNRYRNLCFDICPDVCELANYLVYLSYERHPKNTKKFMWQCGAEGILVNLKSVPHSLPVRDTHGEYEYLGKHYRMERIG